MRDKFQNDAGFSDLGGRDNATGHSPGRNDDRAGVFGATARLIRGARSAVRTSDDEIERVLR